MKISILLPYKENFSPEYPGAVSIFLNDIIRLSKYRQSIKIYGNTSYKKKFLKNYVNINFKNYFFQSRSKSYIKEFLKIEKKINSDIIEIHNRPDYLSEIYKTNKNLVLYFHNNPLDMKSSKTIIERINLLKKTRKIIFNSNWTLNKFKKGINKKYLSNKLQIINQSTKKNKINFKNKKKIILFVGRLNKSKGYDIFGNALINILNKYADWKAVVIGDESREKILFEHKKLNILGFQKNHIVSKWYSKSDICVVCSKWEEPFGRTALEASSFGCAVIISNRGGLPEASPKALKIKNLTSANLQKLLIKLIENKKFKKNVQKRIYNHFYLTNEIVSKKIDRYRKNLIRV